MRSALNKLTLILFAMVALMAASCKKKEKGGPDTPASPGTMKIQFTYAFNGDTKWGLNKSATQPKTGDVLSFSTLKFYISRLRLQTTDGSWFDVGEPYYLIDADGTNKSTITISNIKGTEYVKLEYTMGVWDRQKNLTGTTNTGALATSNGMYWDNTKGYIMIKAEGTSANSSNGNFAMHIGGFEGSNSVLSTRTMDVLNESVFTSINLKAMAIGENYNPTLTFQLDPSALWNNAPSVGVSNSIDAPSTTAQQMAADFYNSIKLVSFKAE